MMQSSGNRGKRIPLTLAAAAKQSYRSKIQIFLPDTSAASLRDGARRLSHVFTPR